MCIQRTGARHGLSRGNHSKAIFSPNRDVENVNLRADTACQSVSMFARVGRLEQEGRKSDQKYRQISRRSNVVKINK